MDWQGWLNDVAVLLPPLPAVPQPPWWLSWLAGGASIATNILLRKLRLEGWIIMLANQFCWGWLALSAGQDGLLASTAFYLYLGGAGLIAWLKDPPVKTSQTRNEKTSERADENPCCLHACGMQGGAASTEDPADDTGATIYQFKPRA